MPQDKKLNRQRRERFSANLQHWLKQEQMTIQALHKQTGIDYQRLRRWVTDGVAHVTSETSDDLEGLVKFFGLDGANLLWSEPRSALDNDFLEEFNQAYELSIKMGILDFDGEEIVSSMFKFTADVKKRSQAKSPSPVKKSPSPVKWTGSKRKQVPQILSHFPKTIKTYYEPFVGGASVLFALLDSDIMVSEYHCSDFNEPLIGIWNLIKDDPSDLIDSYTQMWTKLKDERTGFFSSVRDEFNSDQDPRKLFFLMRTCRRGLIRYSRKGEFNSGLHHGRDGLNPKKLSPMVLEASKKLNSHNVQFEVKDFREVSASNADFLYLDPPYKMPDRTVTYSGEDFDYSALWGWMDGQRCPYILSFRGNVLSHLYDKFYPADTSSLAGSPLPSGEMTGKERLYVRGNRGHGEEGSKVADVVAPQTTTLSERRGKQSKPIGEMKPRGSLE